PAAHGLYAAATARGPELAPPAQPSDRSGVDARWLAVLVILQPRRRACRDPLGRRRPARPRLRSTAARPAGVAARQRDHVPGRGTGPSRGEAGRTRAARPVRHHLLARVPRP